MAHAMDELLNSNTLSEEVRSSLSEAWETQLTEARESITAELREEFAQRYENDKTQIVDAADKMIGEVISKELEEFKDAKKYQEFDALLEVNQKVLTNKTGFLFYRNKPSTRMQTRIQ